MVKGWYSGAAIARDQNDPSTATTCGLIMEGPEYISICRGYDGREITRIDNIPRGGEGSKVSRAKYWSEYWGDDFGNRMDRFFTVLLIWMVFLMKQPEREWLILV